MPSSTTPARVRLAEAMEQALAANERERLVEHLRPQVEQGFGDWRIASAYLAATKPEPG